MANTEREQAAHTDALMGGWTVMDGASGRAASWAVGRTSDDGKSREYLCKPDGSMRLFLTTEAARSAIASLVPPKVDGLEVTELSGAAALEAINGRLRADVPHIKGEKVVTQSGPVPEWSLL